jgi:hypothetical protein
MATTGQITSLPASLTLKDAQAVLESLRQSWGAARAATSGASTRPR